jgi:hypothetical protein
MKNRLTEAGFPNLTSFIRPGDLAEPCAQMVGGTEDDALQPPSAERDQLPVHVDDVPSVDAVIMQRWYPEDIKVESAMGNLQSTLKDRISRMLQKEGLAVSTSTLEALDVFLEAAVAEHRKELSANDPFDSYSSDMKGRGW